MLAVREQALHSASGSSPNLHPLRAKCLEFYTQREPIVLMHADCPVARSEGLSARAQVELHANGRSAVATLYQVRGDILEADQVGLSDNVRHRLAVCDGAEIKIRHPKPLDSMSAVRAKVYGHRLDGDRLNAIIKDIAAEQYSDVQLAAFVSAFSSQPAQLEEMVALTGAMVAVGERLTWPTSPVMDKHCVGGLPANRTTPIVVAIVAAAGLAIPKTSSRAITSPAGTADAMETMAPVDLDLASMRRVVELEGGCIVWGGSVRLSPADDILIRVERALDIDSPAQLVASVLSKKIAAGSSHVVLDLPVGSTAKVRRHQDALELGAHLTAVGAAFDLKVRPIVTDGSQPVGSGIGPALEARDVLSVLRDEIGAPADLRTRAIRLAGAILEYGEAASEGLGEAVATEILSDGRALRKFMGICEAQGGFREPPKAPLRHAIEARAGGVVETIDNRLLARMAKLAGAPESPAAGLELHFKIGEAVDQGQPIITLHGENAGELEYALAFADANPDIVHVRPS